MILQWESLTGQIIKIDRPFSLFFSHTPFSFLLSLTLSIFQHPSTNVISHARDHIHSFYSVSVCPSPSHCRISSLSFPWQISSSDSTEHQFHLFSMNRTNVCTTIRWGNSFSVFDFSMRTRSTLTKSWKFLFSFYRKVFSPVFCRGWYAIDTDEPWKWMFGTIMYSWVVGQRD